MSLTRAGRGHVAAALLCVAALAAASACTRDGAQEGFELGPVKRMNEVEGLVGTFSWPYYTAITARGGKVVASWLNRNGTRDRDVMVRASSDAGDTWSAEQVLNDGEFAKTVSVVPKLAPLPQGDELLIAWHARRNVAGQKYVLVRRSEDFGKTWAPIQALNSVTQSFLPSVGVARDGNVVVAFSDERNVQRDIFANRSLDAGKTWLPDGRRVDRLARADSDAPVVAVGDDGWAYVAWEERPPRGAPAGTRAHIAVAASQDKGQTWGEPSRVDPAGQPVSPIWPALVESGGRLVAAWTGGVTGDTAKSWLWLSTSSDRGATWSAPQVVYEGSVQTFFHLLASGEHVYLVWHAGDTGKPGGVYFNASDDGGATWRQPWAEPLRIDDASSKGDGARHPRMAVHDGTQVAIAWQEDQKKVLLKVSSDGGRSWPGKATEVATNAEKMTVRYPQVALSSAGAFVLWESWTDMTGVRKSVADLDKPTPRDVYVRGVKRR
ncbi:MAG: sialidase family protein [Thermodesulfobacteriota bacterium]